jgi:hypothetical protein
MIEIQQQLEAALTAGKTLEVLGYVNSAGTISNLTVELIGREGYLDLVKQSREILATGLPRPEEFELDLWEQACAEVLESWRKTLAGEHPSRDFHVKTAAHPLGFETTEDSIYLMHLRRIAETEVAPAPVKEGPKSKKGKATTPIKQYLQRTLPIKDYIGTLKLNEDKVTEIRGVAK